MGGSVPTRWGECSSGRSRLIFTQISSESVGTRNSSSSQYPISRGSGERREAYRSSCIDIIAYTYQDGNGMTQVAQLVDVDGIGNELRAAAVLSENGIKRNKGCIYSFSPIVWMRTGRPLFPNYLPRVYRRTELTIVPS